MQQSIHWKGPESLELSREKNIILEARKRWNIGNTTLKMKRLYMKPFLIAQHARSIVSSWDACLAKCVTARYLPKHTESHRAPHHIPVQPKNHRSSIFQMENTISRYATIRPQSSYPSDARQIEFLQASLQAIDLGVTQSKWRRHFQVGKGGGAPGSCKIWINGPLLLSQDLSVVQ